MDKKFYKVTFTCSDDVLFRKIEESKLMESSIFDRTAYMDDIRYEFIENWKRVKRLFGYELIDASFAYYHSVNLIFYEDNDELVEVITGRRYPRYKENMKNFDSTKLYFKPVEEVEVKEVVELLKSLSEKDIERVEENFKKIDQIVLEHKEMVEYDLEHKNENIQFVLNFSNKNK